MAAGRGGNPSKRAAQAEAEALVEAVVEAGEAVEDAVVEAVVEAAEKDIRRGEPLAEVLEGVHAMAASMHAMAAQWADGPTRAPIPRDLDRLLNLFEVIAAKMSTPTAQPGTEAQARTTLGYRLLRNGLGNYGGHGDGFDRAWVDMIYDPTEGRLTISGRPPASVSVRPYFTSSKGIQPGEVIGICGSPIGTADVGSPPLDCASPTFKSEIRVVELLDGSSLPIAAGLPSVKPTYLT